MLRNFSARRNIRCCTVIAGIHHFHVPVYSQVIIRDIKTMEPLGYGRPGLVNLITPMIKAVPILSVMTDDVGVLHVGKECRLRD